MTTERIIAEARRRGTEAENYPKDEQAISIKELEALLYEMHNAAIEEVMLINRVKGPSARELDKLAGLINEGRFDTAPPASAGGLDRGKLLAHLHQADEKAEDPEAPTAAGVIGNLIDAINTGVFDTAQPKAGDAVEALRELFDVWQDEGLLTDDYSQDNDGEVRLYQSSELQALMERIRPLVGDTGGEGGE
jgi:hypothetical protein